MTAPPPPTPHAARHRAAAASMPEQDETPTLPWWTSPIARKGVIFHRYSGLVHGAPAAALVAPHDVHHRRIDCELLEERCLSTRHGERHLERHCLGHIFLVRGLGDVGERAPDG